MYKKLKLENKIDESHATSSLLIFYLESIYEVCLGMVDHDGEREKEKHQNDDDIFKYMAGG